MGSEADLTKYFDQKRRLRRSHFLLGSVGNWLHHSDGSATVCPVTKHDRFMKPRDGLRKSPCAFMFAHVVWVLLFSFLASFVRIRAQEELNPNDMWYRGYILVQAAGELEQKGKLLESLNKYTEAKPLFDHLAQRYPDFQPEIVRYRRELIEEKRVEIKRVMSARSAPPAPTIAGSAAPAQNLPVVSTATNRISPPPFSESEPSFASNPESETLNGTDTEFGLPSWGDGMQVDSMSPTPPGMPRVEISGGSTVGAIASSLHEELTNKDSLIAWLNGENQKLRNSLQQREQSLQQVTAELVQAKSNRDELLRQKAAWENSPESENAQEKIAQLKGLLGDATAQLEEATKRNEKLVSALEQSQQEMTKLRSRIAEVERERDNLVEVVQGEGGSGKALKELMDRNRALTEQLDRAEQLATSLSELNKGKDQDISLLKSEITRIKLERDQLVTENARHQQSIDDLQRKLELLSDGLSAEDKAALANATPAERQENELLRSIVMKQLRRQAQMKQAKELLLAQLDRVGARSDALLNLVDDLAKGSQLSPEEKALFRNPQFEEIIAAAEGATDTKSDESAKAPRSAAAVGAAAFMSATLVAAGKKPGDRPAAQDGFVERKKLSVELTQLEKAARLDFNEGRYAEAEAGFLDYLHYMPQSVPCLCNLGVLKLAMKNYSEAEHYLEKALAIDEKSGLANYLLGRAYFLQDKMDQALEKLERGLNFEPQNAKAHNCIGVISSRKGWVDRAERAFVNAVSIDPKYGDAHFNLAVLYARKDQPNVPEVSKHYHRAVDLGIPRDQTIENFLKEADENGVAVGMR